MRSSKIMSGALILLFLALLMASCDLYEKKLYKADESDLGAYQVLTDTTVMKKLSTFKLTTFDSTWVDSVVTLFVPAIVDSLDTLTVTTGDINYRIITPAADAINYIGLNTAQSTVTLFVTDYVELKLIKKDGTVVSAANLAIDAETVYSCPQLKARLEFNDVNGESLIKIIKSDATLEDTFQLVVK